MLAWLEDGRWGSRAFFTITGFSVSHGDLTSVFGILPVKVAVHFVPIVDRDRLSQCRDANLGDAICLEAHKANGLRRLSVDPFLVVAVTGSLLQFPEFRLRRTHCGKYHLAVHADEDIVLGDSVFEEGWEGICIGFAGGLDTKINDRIEECFDLGSSDFRKAAFKEQRDPTASDLCPVIGDDVVVIDSDVAEKSMLEIRTTVEIEDDAIGLYRNLRNGNAIARCGGLPFFVEHLLVRVAARIHVSVGDQGEAIAQRKVAVGETLLCLEIADQLTLSTFGDWLGRKFDSGGVKVS